MILFDIQQWSEDLIRLPALSAATTSGVPVKMGSKIFLSRATKGKVTPAQKKMKVNKEGKIVKDKEFYKPILTLFPQDNWYPWGNTA